MSGGVGTYIARIQHFGSRISAETDENPNAKEFTQLGQNPKP